MCTGFIVKQAHGDVASLLASIDSSYVHVSCHKQRNHIVGKISCLDKSPQNLQGLGLNCQGLRVWCDMEMVDIFISRSIRGLVPYGAPRFHQLAD
jgi:hypothetical protein